jgi:hypothetical protein
MYKADNYFQPVLNSGIHYEEYHDSTYSNNQKTLLSDKKWLSKNIPYFL